jgi:hypothetical protein
MRKVVSYFSSFFKLPSIIDTNTNGETNNSYIRSITASFLVQAQTILVAIILILTKIYKKICSNEWNASHTNLHTIFSFMYYKYYIHTYISLHMLLSPVARYSQSQQKSNGESKKVKACGLHNVVLLL